jgi:hypothetical protein
MQEAPVDHNPVSFERKNDLAVIKLTIQKTRAVGKSCVLLPAGAGVAGVNGGRNQGRAGKACTHYHSANSQLDGEGGVCGSAGDGFKPRTADY